MADETTALENVGFKGLINTIWQRVILSYKSTLIGIAFQIAAAVADNFVHSPNKTLTIIGSIILWALAFRKDAGTPATLPKVLIK